MSRIVAIDFGLKRTGIAVTDEMKMIASPLETINTHNLFTFLKDYFSRNNVEKIILGFPKDVDENAQIVIAIKKVFTKLKKEFKDKEIILHDERYTSKISSYLILPLIFIFSAFLQTLNANNVVMYATMDSSAIWQGEQIAIKLELVQDKDAQVELLIPQNNLTEDLEIINVSKADTIDIKNNRIQIDREIIITSFDSGFYSIPPIKAVLNNDTFATEPLSLKVVPMQVDEENLDIKDIKNVWSPRFVLFDYIPSYVWIILLVLLLIGVGVYLYIKYFRNRTQQDIIAEAEIIPHEKALEELYKLKEEKLWQSGQEKLYYTQLIDILREYIDSRFSINAMEMTTTEILASLRANKETKLVEANLKTILEVADFVKFAKMRPLPEDNEASMRNAIKFVESTIPQTEEVEEEIVK